jgi:hypothetical protein
MSHNKTIIYYENALTPEFCEHVIDRFNNDTRVQQGAMFTGVDTNIKNSLDLNIFECLSGDNNWSMEDEVLYKSLHNYVPRYHEALCGPDKCNFYPINSEDRGYQIQKTLPGKVGYVWHNDAHVLPDGNWRWLTFIWYLNDVPEEYDGYTEFITGDRIQPKTGTLLLFPATWCMGHRGAPLLQGEKYICTGWVFARYH